MVEIGEYILGNLRGGSGSYSFESLKSVICEVERVVIIVFLLGGMGMEEGVVSKFWVWGISSIVVVGLYGVFVYVGKRYFFRVDVVLSLVSGIGIGF